MRNYVEKKIDYLVDVLGSAGGSVVTCVSGGGVAGIGTATTRPLSATTAGALR